MDWPVDYYFGMKKEMFSDIPRVSEKTTQRFHEWYEALAPNFDYETRKESAVPWEDVPENNKRLMRTTVFSVLTEPGTILCWVEGHGTACDRIAGHGGHHSWVKDTIAEVAMDAEDAADERCASVINRLKGALLAAGVRPNIVEEIISG